MTDHQEPDPLARLAAADPANALPERHDAARLREEIIMTSDTTHTHGRIDRDRRRRATHRRPHRSILAGALAAAVAVAVVSISGTDKKNDLPLIAADPGALNVGAATGASELYGADTKMGAPWYGSTEFTAAGDFDTLDSAAAAWILRSGTTPTAKELERLLRALGIEAEFTKNVEGAGEPWEWSHWVAGTEDGSGPAVTVNGDAMLSWWYTDGWAAADSVVGCAVSEPISIEPDGNVEGEYGTGIGTADDTASSAREESANVEPKPLLCGEPMPLPANLPDETETRNLFSGLLDSLGIDEDDVIIETYLSEWSSSITGWLRLDGVRSPLAVSANYGTDGKLANASGILAKPEKLGDYPRIGTSAGFDALVANYGWYGPASGGPILLEGPAVDESNEVTTAGGEGTRRQTPEVEQGIEEGLAFSEPQLPIEDPTTGEPPITVVEIVDVEADLYMLWGNDNAIYLLPGYSFLAGPDDYGYTPRYSVIAIGAEYFTTGSDTGGWPGSGRGDGDTEIDMISDAQAGTLIGLSEEDAAAVGLENNWSVRVTSRDGEEYAVTMDYRTDRVNLTVKGGTVTDVTVG